MVGAKKYRCRVIANQRLNPQVMHVTFMPEKPFQFEAGQFISAYIPAAEDRAKTTLRRAYSLASSPELSKNRGYELCVKYVPGGTGSRFLEKLQPGDTFMATAPYGDFVYRQPSDERSVCFICTGTGIAPFRSMVLSQAFHERPPASALCLFGIRSEQDLFFRGNFEAAGVETVYCISQPQGNWDKMKDKNGEWTAIRGRVTDYLKTLPNSWNWHTTDFYLCGNSEMIAETKKILVGGHGVSENSIFQEVFFTKKKGAQHEAA